MVWDRGLFKGGETSTVPRSCLAHVRTQRTSVAIMGQEGWCAGFL